MKKESVKMGGRYFATVSGRPVTVKIRCAHPSGGWQATNEATGKQVRIKTAGRLTPIAKAKATTVVTPEVATKATAKPAVSTSTTKAAKTAAKPDTTKSTKANAKADATPAAKGNPVAKAETPQETPQPAKRRGGRVKGQMSGLDAAVAILQATPTPMTTKAIVDAALAAGLWSPEGLTPDRTLYAAILRELRLPTSRFAKVDRGQVTLAS